MGRERREVHGSVAYNTVDDRYFERRGLRRYAGFWSLWALGVGAVVSGRFFGWNVGLAPGGFGFGEMATALAIVALMYLCLCFSIAEMSAALPYTGGAYSFARTALGPWVGFVTGLAECIEYIFTPAVIVVVIGGYGGAAVNAILGIDVAAPIWWLVFYVIFVGINIAGVAATFRVAVVLTLLALGVLAVFWISAAFHFSWELALSAYDRGNSRGLPMDWMGIAQALPFVIWFYLATEHLPLAAEETRRPARIMPRALLWGILTLILASFLTLLLYSGNAAGGWAAAGDSYVPLHLGLGIGFGIIVGGGIGAAALVLAMPAGLVAGFHAIIFAYSRRIYSLSRAGYLPRWLSLTPRSTRTPHLALIAGAVVGYAAALLLAFGEKAGVSVGKELLNMAVFGAVIAYIMQMVSFIRLRQRYPGLYRPYLSPLGSLGAAIAGIIACAVLVFLFINADYDGLGIYACGIFFAVGLLYFALIGRKRLVSSPEENYALRLEEEESR